MYAESMQLSPRWAAEFRGFWDLPGGLRVRRADARRSPSNTPNPAAPPRAIRRRVPARCRTGRGTGRLPAARHQPRRGPLARGHDARGTLRRAAHRVPRCARSSRATRTPTASTSGSRCCRSRVAWADPIVLPFGEAPEHRRNHRRRTSCAATAATTSATGDHNWKLHARSACATATRRSARSTRAWRTATPTGRSCASTSAPAAPGCSRSRPSPPGYPVVHDFLPDLEGFYHAWLGREVPDANGSSVQTGARPPRRR